MNDIFSIFNPDWWMDENNNALQMTDAVLFLLLGIPVAYLFIYALASLRKYKNPLSTVPQATSFPGPLCCVEKRQGSDRVHQSFP